MSDPSRLSISVTHADGSQTRWGYGESDTANIPLGLSFSTALPGGFKDCSFNLPRLLTREYNDEALFDRVTVYGPGNTVAWQGRVQQLPREQGGRATVQVGCVGLSAALKDNPTFREIYTDQDLGRWQQQTTARAGTLASVGYFNNNSVNESVLTSGTPAAMKLRTGWNGQWPALKPIAEAWYDASGISIGKIGYTWEVEDTAAVDVVGNANWKFQARSSSNQIGTATVDTGDLSTAATGSGTLNVTSAHPYAFVQFYYDSATAGGTPGRWHSVLWTLNVQGTHGLSSITASNVIRDVLSRNCPSLPIAQIDDTTFQIPQLTYLEPVTAEDVILDVTKFHLYPWGVYEDGFFWKQNNEATSTVYEARLSEGAQMSLEGDDASAVFNGVVVRYQDEYGTPRVAGPTGYSPADYTSSDLLSSDPNNPATLHGLTRYGVLSISSPMRNVNADGDSPAIQIGRMWLAEASLPQRRGSITLPAMVRHPTEGMIPSWRVRAGDWIKMADRPGDVARRIVSTSYSEDGRSMTLDVGGLPAKVEALLEAIGVQMVGIA